MLSNNISHIGDMCTGCQLCMNVCPKSCITFKTNLAGFGYPTIDTSSCIQCGICKKKCPQIRNNMLNFPTETNIIISKDLERNKSTSGGLFYTIAKHFIEGFGGYVVGAVMNDDFSIVHTIVNSVDELYKIQGSKYCESNTFDLYAIITELLYEKKKVLFSGTPCQCDAMQTLFKNDENFYCLDIVCHGVPSNELWLSNIKYLKSFYNFSEITFRYKDKYEKTGYSLSLFLNGKLQTRIPYKLNGYYSLFMDGRTFRKSCYQCKYATEKRCSDITMGDCNTWDNYKFHKDEVISIGLMNTIKGRELWNLTKNNFNYLELNYNIEKNNNKQLSRPSNAEKRLDDTEINKLILDNSLFKKYELKYSAKDKCKSAIKRVVSVKTREKIKGIFK